MAHDTILIAACGLLAVVTIALAALRGWQDWLGLKIRELDRHPPEIPSGSSSSLAGMGARIEIADLKERIRRLEAIAAGVDL